MAKLYPEVFAFAPALGLGGALAGGAFLAAIMGYRSEKNDVEPRIRLDDFKEYLEDSIANFAAKVEQKRELIRHAESEIIELETKINQYQHLLSDDYALAEELEKVNAGRKK